MSYILDALRKSEQQRKHSEAPITLTSQAVAVAPGRPGISLNGLLAVILVGTGIVIGWLRPWQGEQAVPVAEPVAAQPSAAVPRLAPPVLSEVDRRPESAAPVSVTPLRKTVIATQSTAVPDDVAPMAATSAVTQSAPLRTPSGAAAGGAATAATPGPDKPGVRDLAVVEPEQRVMALAELPASVRQEMPGITISLHGYSSNPKERLVMINNILLRQGDQLAPELRLEQITPDGVVLSYKGYRFHRGVR